MKIAAYILLIVLIPFLPEALPLMLLIGAYLYAEKK